MLVLFDSLLHRCSPCTQQEDVQVTHILKTFFLFHKLIIDKSVDPVSLSLYVAVLMKSNIAAVCIVSDYISICVTDIYVDGYRLTCSENTKLGYCHCHIGKNVNEK